MSLPPYWESHYDAQLGKMYYVHKLSNIKQYEFPGTTDKRMDGPEHSYNSPHQTVEDAMSAMSLAPNGQQTASVSSHSHQDQKQPETAQYTCSSQERQPVSSPTVYPPPSNVHNWSSQPENSQSIYHSSASQPSLQQSAPNPPPQMNPAPQGYPQPLYVSGYQQNPSTPYSYQPHLDSPSMPPNTQRGVQTSTATPLHTLTQPYYPPLASSATNPSSANPPLMQLYNPQQNQAGVATTSGYPHQPVTSSAPLQHHTLQQPPNSGVPNSYQQPLGLVNVTPMSQCHQPGLQPQAVSPRQNYQGNNLATTYPNQGHHQPGLYGSTYSTGTNQAPPSPLLTTPMPNIIQPMPVNPMQVLSPQQPYYNATTRPLQSSTYTSQTNSMPHSGGSHPSDPRSPLSSPQPYSAVPQSNPMPQMTYPAPPNQGYQPPPPNAPTTYTSNSPTPYSVVAPSPRTPRITTTETPYNNAATFNPANSNPSTHTPSPAQPQLNEDASTKGLTTGVKKFFKGTSKGKLALGVGGALLAGLVGAEIGDSMSGLFDSSAGLETADFSGFEGGGGEGADAAYAETPVGAGGYDQLATQGYGNDLVAQAQENGQGYI